MVQVPRYKVLMKGVKFQFQVLTCSKISRLQNRLFLTGAIRLDGSSVFGEDQRNQVYYKASGSYVLSDNAFWQQSMPWWTTLKLRAAYGESGNLTGIGAYDRINAYSSNSYLSRIALSGSAVWQMRM